MNFRNWVENREFMAKGVSMKSNLPLARHMAGLYVVDGMSPKQIAQDSQVMSQGGLPDSSAVARVLRAYGLNSETNKSLQLAKQKHQQLAQMHHDKYHNVNLHGTNPERNYVSKTGEMAMRGEQPLQDKLIAPPGYHKVKDAKGKMWLRPEEHPVYGDEKVASTRQKVYARKPQARKSTQKIITQQPIGLDQQLKDAMAKGDYDTALRIKQQIDGSNVPSFSNVNRPSFGGFDDEPEPPAPSPPDQTGWQGFKRRKKAA